MAIWDHKVTYFFRKPLAQYHSVETMFSIMLAELPPEVRFQAVYVPFKSSGLVEILKNYFYAGKHQAPLNHITGDIYYVAPALKGKTILTILDIETLSRGNALRRLFVSLMWFWLPAIKAARIAVISEFTKKQLERVIPFAKNKIVVIHCPADPSLKHTPGSLNAIKPRILHIGTKSNKNLERTLEAISGVPCSLVIVGKLTEQQKDLLVIFGIEYENHQNVSRQQLVEQYVLCDLLCFASSYEGFGLPIIEANAIGRPVVAGNAGSIPEVAHDAACLVNPYSVEDIRRGILRVIGDAQYRDQLVQNGLKNIVRFNAKKITEQYVALYNEVLSEGKR